MEFLSEIIYRDTFIIKNGCHSRDAMIIVLKGRFSCEIEGKNFTAHPGDICIFPAEVTFTRKVLEPLRCIYIQFTPFPTALFAGKLSIADPSRTSNTIEHLEQAVIQADKGLTEHLLQDIFLFSRQPSLSGSKMDETVNACISLFRQKLDSRISLELLAQSHAISKQALIRKFRRFTGKTPMEYLSALRLERSKELLKNTTLSIGEIASQCGFENVYYFSNHFKHHTGISPTNYRKLLTL